MVVGFPPSQVENYDRKTALSQPPNPVPVDTQSRRRRLPGAVCSSGMGNHDPKEANDQAHSSLRKRE